MEIVYVLINVKSGGVENVVNSIKGMENIAEISVVTGNYDLIAKVQGEYITEVLTTVVRGIRQIEDVTNTETLVVVNL